MSETVYDEIGHGYASRRRPDARWSSQILSALGSASSVVNVGAGAGSYEPAGRSVIGVEPSEVMIGQRPPSAAPVVRGVAEQLPFCDDAFDVALAILTVHHWTDPDRGLAEMRRVAPRQMVVTWSPEVVAKEFWLVRDYLPEVVEREADLATLSEVVAQLGPDVSVEKLLVPRDCTDGFLGAYWKRPQVYLDPTARRAISGLALLDPILVERAAERLAADVASGRWQERNNALAELEAADLGYRIVTAGSR